MLCLFLAVTLAVTVNADLRAHKIVEHPYLVSIHENVYLCSGAIISPNYVITTAQCMANYNESEEVTIRSGSSDVYINGDKHNVTNVTLHESHAVDSRPVHDIAVLRVDPPFQFNDTCKSIRLIEAAAKVSDDVESTIVHWKRYGGKYQLEVSSSRIIKHSVCESIMNLTLPNDKLLENQICAINKFTKDHISALIVADGRLTGIGSWGSVNMPTIFTEIAAYHDWIVQHSDVTVNFMPKISASLLLIVLVQVCIVIMRL